MKEKIFIFQRIVPHYRVGFFKKLSLFFPDITIFYGQPYKGESLKNAKDLDEKLFIRVKNFYLHKYGKIFFSNFYFKLFKYRPDIIISIFNVGNLNIYFLFFLKIFLKYKIVLWSFGYDPFEGFIPQKKLIHRIRLILSQKADAVIFYWEKGRKEVANYSKKTEHYFIAQNTLDTDKQFELKESFDNIGKNKIIKELGVKQKFHFIYVGRLLEDKQIDLLLKAFSIVEKKNYDCRLSIIGNGPEFTELKKLSDKLNLKNIKFLGEILDEETTGKWIYISDAFVMPGRLGLSVVHTFCFGTPIISQEKEIYYHGEGIGYVKDRVNGFLIEDENVDELAEKMILIISNPELCNNLRINAFQTAKNECAIERMIGGFAETLSYLQSK